MGQDRSVRFGKNGPRDGLVAAADGTFWSFNYRVLQHGPKGKRLRYLELGGCIGLAASPDGPVWVGTCLGPGYRLTRFDEDGRTVTEVPYAVPDNPEPRVTADGRVWVQGTKGRLYRYDGETWRKVKPPKGAEDTMVGGDGMLWSRGRTGTGAPVLFRFGGDTWQRWNVPDDGPDVIQRELRVTPDARLLAFGAGPEGDDCAGVGVSHGDAWASFLQDHCVHDAVMGAEGRLWVQARPQGSGWLDPMEMHLILPG